MEVEKFRGTISLLRSPSNNNIDLKYSNKTDVPLLRFENQNRSFILLEKYCETYNCTCQAVSLGLIELDGAEIRDENPNNIFLNLDLNTWEEVEKPDRQTNVQDLVEEFLTELPEQLKIRFRTHYKENREKIISAMTFRMPLKDLYEGIMVSYSKVFSKDGSVLDGNFGCSFIFSFESKQYVIEDLYCMNPECDCQAARFMFLEINNETNVLSEIFSVFLSFQNEVDFDSLIGCTKTEAMRIFGKWRESLPTLLHHIKFRYEEIKQVGVQIILDESNAVSWSGSLQDGERKKKIGRNDPCPCGSGKKYKKCCWTPIRN
jgi:hypothetical protein